MINKVFDLIEKDITKIPEPQNSNSFNNSGSINLMDKLDLGSATREIEEKLISSSTLKKHILFFSEFQNQIFERQALTKKQEYDREVDREASNLRQVLECFSLEADEISFAERKIIDIVDTYSFSFLGDVIQKIYIQYNDYPMILVGICKSLERFDYNEVMPWGPTMLMGLLNHKNDLVKEVAIGLVENWANVEFLPALRNIECKSSWMQDYINDVVRYLEGKDVLRKKTV